MPSSEREKEEREDLDGHRRWNDRSSAAFFVAKGFSIGYSGPGLFNVHSSTWFQCCRNTIEREQDNSTSLGFNSIKRKKKEVRAPPFIKSRLNLNFENDRTFQIFKKRGRGTR